MLLCTPDSLPIHIYGFNWHGRMWQGHKASHIPDNVALLLRTLSQALPVQLLCMQPCMQARTRMITPQHIHACWAHAPAPARMQALRVVSPALGAQVASEKAFLEALVPSGRVVIHDTTCYGQRECGPGDHDQSCHWGSDSKYYCLR